MSISFLSDRLTLARNQQRELASIAARLDVLPAHHRLALECLALRQAALAAELARVAGMAAPCAALRGREVAA